MEKVIERSKEYEQLVVEYDPLYKEIVEVIKIVKQFIRDHNLILYGGSAIDFALRLHGDKIYPDESLAVADLDFFSPESVSHAYKLAEILYHKGYKESRAIVATHVQAMRVDIADNHFIADISYMPKEIFERLPYVEFDGMKVVHPDFQRIDLHSSLCFPYDNAPREVIFNRWNKDIKRFNILDKYYPIATPAVSYEFDSISIPAAILTTNYLLCGVPAYAILFREFKSIVGGNIPPGVIRADFTVGPNETITFNTIGALELMHMDPEKVINNEQFGLTDVKCYEPLMNLFPQRYVGRLNTQYKIDAIIYSTKHRLTSMNSVTVEGIQKKIRIVNIQYLLKHFISRALAAKFFGMQGPADVYFALYNSIIKMIRYAESATKISVASPLFPSVVTYGSDNIAESYEIAMMRLANTLTGSPPPYVPENYRVSKGKRPKDFVYVDSEYFREAGREIKPCLSK